MEAAMNHFTTLDQTKIFYKDMGDGAPIVLIHGWPLSADMWDEQAMVLLEAGYRVIAYDRRGFGRSEQPAQGYDYDTFASDLNDLLIHLNLHQVSLVGFSMGGGEVARYLSRYGAEKVSSVALVSSVTPLVMKTRDNPEGVPETKLKEIIEGIKKDRFAFFHSFFKDFFGVNVVNHPTSDQTLEWAERVASQASLKATVDCVDAFGRTDFRADMSAFIVPTLIIHGTSDKTVPIATAGAQAAKMIPGAIYKPYDGAPHGLNVTHKHELNHDLLDFLREFAPKEVTYNRKFEKAQNRLLLEKSRH
jgi:pimeloyl-ACP methyl ester carboxylesterase